MMHSKFCSIPLAMFFTLGLFAFGFVPSVSAAEKVDFLIDVKPVLEHNCIACHQEKKAKGKLRLDTKELAFKDEDVLTAGNSEDSSLFWTCTLEADDDEVMPPQEGPDPYVMTKAEQDILKNWIEQGADWPDGEVLAPRKRLPSKVDFVEHVQPILEVSCVKCHRADKAKGKVRLDTKSEAFKDEIITPGKPHESSIWWTCTLPEDDELLMPPVEEVPLEAKEIAILRRWIEEGADWPEGLELKPKKRVDTVLGISPQELYTKLGLKAGPAAEPLEAYTQGIPPLETTFEMLPIKGGTFTMGSPEAEEGRKDDEMLPRQMKVDSFWMGKYELTWDEYELWQMSVEIDERKYLKAESTERDLLADAVTRCTRPYTDMTFGMGKRGYPAICMTHLSARMYTMWLSAKTGRFYRLPTDAEWEYACRANTTTRWHFGDDKKDLGTYAWTYENSDWQYQKVGTKKANPFGLHDMHGNAWEWVLDDYDLAGYAKGDLLVNPLRLPKQQYGRTVRGGGWDDKWDKQRSAARMKSIDDWKKRDPQIPQSVWYLTDAHWVGFRVVRPAEVPPIEEITKYWPSIEEMTAIPDR